MPTRSLPPFAGNLLTLLLLAALAVRALVPAGWMPAASAAGATVLVFCPGVTPAVGPTAAMPGMHHGKTGDPAHPAAEHPCAFAGLGLAWVAAAVPSIVLPRVVAALSRRGDEGVAGIGRGLAAPPPPATGPPPFA